MAEQLENELLSQLENILIIGWFYLIQIKLINLNIFIIL